MGGGLSSGRGSRRRSGGLEQYGGLVDPWQRPVNCWWEGEGEGAGTGKGKERGVRGEGL